MPYKDKRRESEYGKAYYAANRAKILSRQIARNATEHAKAINRKAVAKYRAAHEAERKAYAAARYAADPERYREQGKKWKKRWYAANTEEARRRANDYGTAHAGARAKRAADWRKANPERVKELNLASQERRRGRWIEFLEQERERYRKAYEADPGKYSAKGAKRRCAQLLATPSWVDLRTILDIYRHAQEISRVTGIEHEVDHIIPLRGKTVWGLHIPINLQILTSTENRRKFNRLIHDATNNHKTPVLSSSVATQADGRYGATYSGSRSPPGGQKHGVNVDGNQASAD